MVTESKENIIKSWFNFSGKFVRLVYAANSWEYYAING